MTTKPITLRQSQLITAFGPGAMVDLPTRSVVIGGLDLWHMRERGSWQPIHEPRATAVLETLLRAGGRLAEDARRIAYQATVLSNRRRQALNALATQLEMLNPQRTLERGYAMVLDAKGRIVRAPGELRPRELITLRLAEGSAEVGVASVQPALD